MTTPPPGEDVTGILLHYRRKSHLPTMRFGSTTRLANATLLLMGYCALALVVLGSSTATSATMPSEFLGWWCFDGQNYQRKKCQESDGTLRITPRGYIAWEHGCDITKVTNKGRQHYHMQFRCSGMGKKGTLSIARRRTR